MSGERLRIISDLHFAETGSHLQRLPMLEPVLEGADRIVFNGDTLETRFLDIDPRTAGHKVEWDAFAAAHGRGGRFVLVTGNHDPDLTDCHHLDLVDGGILVTHGDTMFPRMAPWGWEARYFQSEQEKRLEATPEAERHTLETRLRVCKEAVMAIRDLSPRYPGPSSHPWHRRLRFVMAVRRADSILHSWWRMPEMATRLLETFRPQARIVIVGHTHNPGLWRVRGRIVINTGSFVPFMGGQAVDLVDGRLELRKLRRVRGEFRLATPHAVLDLAHELERPCRVGGEDLPPSGGDPSVGRCAGGLGE